MTHKPTARVWLSIPLTANERSHLHLRVRQRLPISLPKHVVDAVLSELEDATAFAKPSADYEKAALRNRTMDRSVRRWNQYGRQPDKVFAHPLRGLKATTRLTIKPSGGGRPRNVIADILMRDVQNCLIKHRIPAGWKTGAETRLVNIFKACAEVAGLSVPDEPRGIW